MSTLIDRIQYLREAGRSQSQIAEILSLEEGRHFTRGVIAGAIHRAGLPLLPKKPPKPKRPTAPKRKKPGVLTSGRVGIRGGGTGTKPPTMPTIKPEDIASMGILDLKASSCRFICGDPKTPLEEIYCGGWAVEGSPYCCAHTRRSWQGGGR